MNQTTDTPDSPQAPVFHFANPESAEKARAVVLDMKSPPPVGEKLIIVTSTGHGTGKTTLAQEIIRKRFNTTPVTTAYPTTEREWDRAIAVALASNAGYLFLDNAIGEIGSINLAAFCTSERWSWRPIGTTTTESAAANLLIIITGNNLELSEDIRRRAILIELAAAPEPAPATGDTKKKS